MDCNRAAIHFYQVFIAVSHFLNDRVNDSLWQHQRLVLRAIFLQFTVTLSAGKAAGFVQDSDTAVFRIKLVSVCNTFVVLSGKVTGKLHQLRICSALHNSDS